MHSLRHIVIVAVIASLGLSVTFAQSKKTTGDPALLTTSRTGSVLHTPGMTAILWGSDWSNSAFAGDIIAGLDTLLGGYSGSTYANVATEYYDQTGSITPFTSYSGHVFDSSAPPAPGGLTPSVALAEACRVTGNAPNPGDIYIVFTSTDHGTGACGFHTYGTCGSRKTAVPIQVAAIPYASGIAGSGCDGLQDVETGHSLALAQIANIAIHEVVETITDPRNSGWRDGFGDEIADKCMRVFPPSLASFPVFSNGSTWKLQAEWSNAAYLAGTGTANESGQRGCIW